MDRILLIDGLNSIWRANIAFKSGEKQEPSFVIVYNFFRNLRATLEELEPTKVFFCLEGSDNFRYKLYSEYKGNRIIKNASIIDGKDMEDFYRQVNIIVGILTKLPIILVKATEYECDDVIATLADNMKDEDVIILSNDSDYIQLLQKGYERLRIYNPFKKEFMVAPEYHYLTWKCLAGDKKTDNIPGMVGPKTAEKLSQDVEKFAEFMDSPENRASYSLNKELIELKIIPDDALQFTDYDLDYERVREYFSEMAFKTILEENYWNRFCKTFSTLR